MLQTLDNILNRYTMYRVVLYSLVGLLLVGFAFGLTGSVSISASGLLFSTLVLVVVCYAVNRALSYVFKVATSTESWLITALILALILPPQTHPIKLLAVAMAAAVAMLSKFILVWRHSPLFNPAAVAALIMSLNGLLPATWWVGSPAMAVFAIIVAAILLRKQRKFSLFLAFAAASATIFLLVNHLSNGQSVLPALKTLAESWPLIFMGSVMLTEPSTLPATRYYQVLYGLLVGAIFTSQLHAGRVSTTPQAALVVGNIFAFIVTVRFAARLRLKQQNKLAPNIHELVFETPKHLKFLPGQYMQWTLAHPKVDSRGNRRSFSIASSPTESELRLAYKTYETTSSFKKALQTLKPGQHLTAGQPTGDFILPVDQAKPLIFIAGGIGITPFRSMIKYLVDSNERRQISLFYVARPDEFVYRDLLDSAKRVGVTVYYSSEKIGSAELTKVVEAVENPLIYISGPNTMVRYYKQQLKNSRILKGQIHTDYFSGY